MVHGDEGNLQISRFFAQALCLVWRTQDTVQRIAYSFVKNNRPMCNDSLCPSLQGVSWGKCYQRYGSHSILPGK